MGDIEKIMPMLRENGDLDVLQNRLQVEALASIDNIEWSQRREFGEEDMVDNGLQHATFTTG